MSKGKEDTKSDPNETLGMGCDAFLLAVYGVIQSLGTDERPEVLLTAALFVVAHSDLWFFSRLERCDWCNSLLSHCFT